MPLADFERQRRAYSQMMQVKYAHIVDALSGKRLDIFEQCVPIKLQGATAILGTREKKKLSAADVAEVSGLATHLSRLATARLSPATELPFAPALLVVAGPASGKTSLMSQLVMHALVRDESSLLVPVLIKIMDMARYLAMREHEKTFAGAWNFADAVLQITLGASSPRYRLLRQAMMARRVLLLLDGVDEGGTVKLSIEQHIAKVLAPQGHPMVVTSRPAGLTERLYVDFERLELCPLSLAQQTQVWKPSSVHTTPPTQTHQPNTRPLEVCLVARPRRRSSTSGSGAAASRRTRPSWCVTFPRTFHATSRATSASRATR